MPFPLLLKPFVEEVEVVLALLSKEANIAWVEESGVLFVRESLFVNFGVAWGLAKEMRSSFTTANTDLVEGWAKSVPLLLRLVEVVMVMGEGESGDVAEEKEDG